jgi:hypothetical protein
MRTLRVILIGTLLFAFNLTRAEDPAGADVRLNEIQVLGTHNSYHQAPTPPVSKLIASASPKAARSLDYSHHPLPEQFSKLGIRQIELDVFADPKGGLFAQPSARQSLEKLGEDPGPDPNADGALAKPGFKVLHVPDVDYRSTVPTFLKALSVVRDWSKANPTHVPIMILVELKDSPTPTLATKPAPIGPAELDALDAEIRSVFEPAQMITPDDVRGEYPTLPQALQKRGWPLLDSSRGKVLFALDNEDAHRALYLEGHEALKGRIMFVSVDSSHAAAGWMKMNDAIKDFDRIQTLVRSGFLVRTRADADTTESRTNDTSRREKAFNSGAQFISTDYPEARPDFSEYCVRFPGFATARPNPLVGKYAGQAIDFESRRTSASADSGR